MCHMPRDRRSPRTAVIDAVCDGSELFTAAQAAEFLAIEPANLRNLTRKRCLCPAKIGHRTIYTRADLERFAGRVAESVLVEGFELGRSPIDLYLEFPGRWPLETVSDAMHQWAKLAGVWLVEGPRGSYARWLSRLGVVRVSPRELRRIVELLLADSELCRRVRVHLDADRQRTERAARAVQAPTADAAQ